MRRFKVLLLVTVVLVGIAVTETRARQRDLTTLLSQFLNDLWAGTLGATVPVVFGGAITFSPTNTYAIGTSRTAGAPSNIFAGTGIEAGSYFGIAGLGLFTAPADGVFLFRNNAGTNFTRLSFGGNTTGFNGITPVLAAAVPQGFILQRGDGTPQTFANLGAATDGAMIYCSDCTFANPCAGSGSGAIAKRLAGAWRCD